MIAAVVFAVVAWFAAPSLEEWRLSGTWYIVDYSDGGVMAIRLRWWGGFYEPRPDGDHFAAQWRVEDGRLHFRPRVSPSTWATIAHIAKGEPAYEDAQVFEYRMRRRGLEITSPDDGVPILLCRTPDAALREAMVFIEPTPAAESMMPLQTAAAVFGGALWQVRCDYRVGGARVALFEAGPEGFRRLLTSEPASPADRLYVGCRRGSDGTTDFVVLSTTSNDPRRVDASAETFPVLAAADVLPSGTVVRLRRGWAVPLAADGDRRLLVTLIDKDDGGPDAPGEWSAALPDGVTEVGR